MLYIQIYRSGSSVTRDDIVTVKIYFVPEVNETAQTRFKKMPTHTLYWCTIPVTHRDCIHDLLISIKIILSWLIVIYLLYFYCKHFSEVIYLKSTNAEDNSFNTFPDERRKSCLYKVPSAQLFCSHLDVIQLHGGWRRTVQLITSDFCRKI